MKKGQGLPLVKSAVRAIEVLELFSRERRPLTLGEMIEMLGYPQSSATVMLKCLVTIGYLNYNIRRRSYFPSVFVTKLGDWISVSQLVNGPIAQLMQDIHEKTNESVTLGVQNDINIHFLSVINSAHKIRFHIPERGYRTLLQSNLGWMLLSEQNDSAIELIYDRIKLTKSHKMVPFEELMCHVQDIRSKGYCFVPNLPVYGAASVAMLLPTQLHDQPLVIGVGGHVPRLEANLEDIVLAMRSSIDRFAKLIVSD